jgi:hypothetical protein
MKKKFLLVMIALLSVTLLFFACSSSDDDDDPPPPPNLSSAAGLTSVLGKTITGFGTQTGAADDLITGSVTVPNATPDVDFDDFVASTGATVKIFDDDTDFTAATETVTIGADTTTLVYVVVTAEDGTTKLHYEITVTEPAVLGAVSSPATEFTAGEAVTPAVQAVYEITLTTLIDTNADTLTIDNVGSATAVYTYNSGGGEDALATQATLTATAINGVADALYDATTDGAKITLTAKLGGVIATAPTATFSSSGAALGGVEVATVGAAEIPAVAAVYTITITTAIESGEKIVFTYVKAGTFEYAFEDAVTTANDQAAAAAAAITGDGDALYTASASGAVITLTAKTAGAISDAPDAEVEFIE